MRLLAVAGILAALPLFAQPPQAQECINLRHHGDPGARACFQKLTRSADPAIQAEGLWGTGDFRDANDAFRAAVKAHDKDPGPRVRWGRMFLEHWQAPDAADLFKEALDLKADYAPALLGVALVQGENYDGAAVGTAENALEADPKLYEAEELIASVTLEDNQPEKAEAAAQKALQISPEALDAMAVLATIDLLADKKDTPWMERALKVNPHYGKAYAIAAHFFVNNRRYDEGIALYRKALELDPTMNDARSEMGVNLMRLGQEDEARKALEECYNAGYQSPETVNSLRLLDSYKDYVTEKTPHGNLLRLQKKEAALLRPYFAEQFDLAVATYEKKYKFKLQKPVQVEVFPNHEDFAVRTVSMPGIGGILGVTFGYVVAMDSPSGRKPGDFHWASTMWHELSHVYVLEMTGHRVPRWFTEGLAVYEETGNGHPEWGDRLDPPSMEAVKDKKLLPVTELDRGFIHPSYPDQVTVSYFQGGKICNFIQQKWGYDKLVAMIHDYAGNMPTAEVIEKEFQIKPEEFDKEFLAWLESQVMKTADLFDDWKKQVRALVANDRAKKWDEVITQGLAIRDIYPEYVEPGSIYECLSDAYLAKGDKVKAVAELERYSNIGGRGPEVLKQLSSLENELGHKAEAAKALDRLNLIYLEDEDAHQRLGALDLDLKNSSGAVREFQAVLAFPKPIDPAGAHFGMARAYMDANRIPEAKDEVISALEDAPGFKPAQKLLLELNGKE